MKHTLLLFAALWLAISPAAAWGQSGWEKVPSAPSAGNYETLVAAPEGNFLLAVAEQNLYGTDDGGRSWSSLFNIPVPGKLRNSFSNHPQRWFALSSDGLFTSSDRGKNWRRQRIFSSRAARDVHIMAAHPRDPEVLVLGTQDGLYWSLDGGKAWAKRSGPLSLKSIRCLAFHPEFPNLLFAASDRDIYRSEDWGRTFIPVFHLAVSLGETETEEETDLADPEIIPESPSIYTLKIDPLSDQEIWAGTARGVYISRDLGRSWQTTPVTGLGPGPVRDLEISAKDGTVFAATRSGVFYLNRQKKCWIQMEGLSNTSVQSLRIIRRQDTESLFALSENQIFRWAEPWPPEEVRFDQGPLDENALEKYRLLLEREPPLAELHRAAIRYSDTGNAKIKRWHLLSRLKSLVPSLSLDKNLSVNSNLDLDRGATNTPDFYISGPDTRDTDLNLSLDWDLASLIWGSEQTSIDSREKLMVELRNDILNEVTRLYFERRRLMLELALSPPASEKELLELRLRIEEIAGYLDALTGGYFARRDFLSSASRN
jgi:photosystem II stability/assembly factor-like uncharacterized protein